MTAQLGACSLIVDSILFDGKWPLIYRFLDCIKNEGKFQDFRLAGKYEIFEISIF